MKIELKRTMSIREDLKHFPDINEGGRMELTRGLARAEADIIEAEFKFDLALEKLASDLIDEGTTLDEIKNTPLRGNVKFMTFFRDELVYRRYPEKEVWTNPDGH